MIGAELDWPAKRARDDFVTALCGQDGAAIEWIEQELLTADAAPR